MEVYFKKSLSTGDSYLLLYINDPAIIIGKHQNTIEEVNREYVKEHDIYVVRRMSGEERSTMIEEISISPISWRWAVGM